MLPVFNIIEQLLSRAVELKLVTNEENGLRKRKKERESKAGKKEIA